MSKVKRSKELKELISSLGEEIRELKYGKKYQQIEKEYREKQKAFFEEVQPQLQELNTKLENLLEEQRELRKKKEPLKISNRLAKWLREYSRGVDWGYGGLLIREILDPEERFVIITNPGSTAGQGTPMGTHGYYYSKTMHWVADTFVEGSSWGSHQQNLEIKGKYILSNGRVMRKEVEGRLTKEKRQILLDAVEEYKKLRGIS